jgi:hypothetical protein
MNDMLSVRRRYGFGCGPVFGACNSLPAQHGVAVTGTHMTLLQLGVSGGNTVGPFVASRLFEVESIGGVRYSLIQATFQQGNHGFYPCFLATSIENVT